jgi:hypothetical protein
MKSYAEVTATGSEDFGFIFFSRWGWDLINFVVLGLAFIAVVLAIYRNDSVKMKIIHVIILALIPIIGILFFYGRLLYMMLRIRNLRRHQRQVC